MKTNANCQVSKQIARALRLKNMDARELAIKARTSLSWIIRLKNANGNPTVHFLRRISGALGIKFQLSI
jgi:transcriptional regulator with XRE-family HTH domain